MQNAGSWMQNNAERVQDACSAMKSRWWKTAKACHQRRIRKVPQNAMCGLRRIGAWRNQSEAIEAERHAMMWPCGLHRVPKAIETLFAYDRIDAIAPSRDDVNAIRSHSEEDRILENKDSILKNNDANAIPNDGIAALNDGIECTRACDLVGERIAGCGAVDRKGMAQNRMKVMHRSKPSLQRIFLLWPQLCWQAAHEGMMNPCTNHRFIFGYDEFFDPIESSL